MIATENPKNENVQSFFFVRTLMTPEKALVFELIVSQQMANIWSTTS
jgi:hypothetical protein